MAADPRYTNQRYTDREPSETNARIDTDTNPQGRSPGSAGVAVEV